MEFNPHNEMTADGHLITEGLPVWTYDYEVGRVVADPSGQCCGDTEHGTSQRRFGTLVEFSGWCIDQTTRSTAVLNGCACGHDHWFTVEYPSGKRGSFNGERLTTRLMGKAAADEVPA